MVLQFPTFALILVAGLNLTWIVTFRRLRPDRTVATSDPVRSKLRLPDWSWLRGRAADWLDRHRTESAMIAFGAALGLLLVLTGPETAPESMRPPLSNLHYVRTAIFDRVELLAPGLAASGSLAGLVLLAYAHRRRSFVAARTGLLVCGLGLASLGQLAILGFYSDPAGVSYGLAIAFFAAWAWAWSGQVEADLFQSQSLSWAELAAVGAVLALTIFARFHRIGTIPYGIEGDESRWTVEVVHGMVDGRQVLGTEYHISSVPVSFYMQALFHRLLGPGIHSARVAVATFSVLASLAFYWAARQLTRPALAALSTFLLGISVFDISASRLANVESHVKLWPVLSLGLLAFASRERKLFSYLLAGTAVALGMLTYDTVWPLVGVGGMALLIDLRGQRVSLRRSVRWVTAYLVPQLLALPITLAYLSGRLQYYGVERRWSGDPVGTALVHLSDLLDSIFRATHGDFLYNRFGPLFNSLLLPWLVLGSVAALYHWRRGRLIWLLLFAALFFLPVPLLTNAPAGRVLYPGIPAAYLLIAIALWVMLQELRRVMGEAWTPLLYGIGAVGLSYLAALNLYIYFNEVRDFADRELRRELYQIARATARKDGMTFYPYVPQVGDPIEHEADYAIWLGYRSRSPSPGSPLPYVAMPMEEFPGQLAQVATEVQHLEIVWPVAHLETSDDRTAGMSWLQSCFPDIPRLAGRFHDRHVVTETLRLQSPCLNSGG